MSKSEIYTKGLVGAFILCVLLPAAVSAQERCGIKLRIFEFKEEGSSEQFPVDDAQITLSDAESGKAATPIKKDGSRFAELNVGRTYRIEIRKRGFKTTIDRIGCEDNDVTIPASRIFFVWPGKEADIVSPALFDLRRVKKNSPALFDLRRVKKNSETVGDGRSDDLTAVPDTDIPPVVSANSQSTAELPGEVVNGKAKNLVVPKYPAAARAVRAIGTVYVMVTIDELGYVVSAKAIGGHPLLRAASVKAASESTFSTTTIEGYPVRVKGVVVYNFRP
ncbi:MAG: energy transducer TonB [Acidobacteria bacterium]|nr:energy transducer TonB [Acidobacteriota bacterium]